MEKNETCTLKKRKNYNINNIELKLKIIKSLK